MNKDQYTRPLFSVQLLGSSILLTSGSDPLWHSPDVDNETLLRLWLSLRCNRTLAGRDLIAAFLPDMTPESHQAFLDLVADEVETGIALYQDQARTHRAEEVISASHVHIRDIPPYSPELNPCERFFEELRKKIANTVFTSLEEIEAVLTDALRHYWDNPKLLTRLTAYS